MSFINIKNLKFEYFRRDENGDVTEMIEALSDINLGVKKGELIAIAGRNGSGKTTLAKHINALLLPTEGSVAVADMDTVEESLRIEIRKKAGMVFQNPDNQIVGTIVEEDVAFGPENIGVPTPEIWNRVEFALEEVEMQNYRLSSPNHLSGGQKQRVAIAGVLAMEPACIIFDEATAMLDPAGRESVIKIARRLNKEKNITVIFVTHHMDEVIWADKVFLMDQGKLVFQGTPKQIFREEKLLKTCGLELPQVTSIARALFQADVIASKYQDSVSVLELVEGLKQCEIKALRKEKSVSYQKEIKKKSDLQNDSIILNHISYTYNMNFYDEKKALDDVEFVISKGEFIGLIGHTGSGKSTLIQHLNGLLSPTKGEIYFNGQDIGEKGYDLNMLRQKVGIIFQYPEHQLFAETVFDDVCYGPINMGISKLEAQKRAFDAIASVGLSDEVYDLSPFQLSEGQKRRAAIAGVLAMEPDYLILDEPVAGLDPEGRKKILQMLKQLHEERNIAVLLVSHCMEDVAEYADRVVVMNESKILLDNTPDIIFGLHEQLEAIHLKAPILYCIIDALRRQGIPIECQSYRFQDVLEALLYMYTGA